MSITWNGVSSDTIGVIVERIPNRYVPTRRFSPQQVAGRNGNILLVDKSFPNVEQEYEVYLSAEAQGLPSVARACAEWLMGPDGYCRLEDSYDTTVYREAFLMGGYDLENILNKFGRCTITFSCKPQKYLLTGDTPIEIPAGITTYTGDVVQFDGVTGASITSLSTTISPTQDLHGYSSPWPAGGGKNKGRFASDITDGSRTQNGCTSSPVVGELSKVHITGTANGGTYYFTAPQTFEKEKADNKFLSAGTYTISTNLPRTSGGVNAGMYITGHYTDGTSVSGNIAGYAYDGHPVTFTISQDVYYNVQASVPSGYSFGDGMDIWVQIESGSSNTAWTPCSNICPISGRTGLSVYDDPKYGGTVAWNQLVQNGNFADGTNKWAPNSGTYNSITTENGELNCKVLKVDADNNYSIAVKQDITIPETHVVLISAEFKPMYSHSMGFYFIRDTTKYPSGQNTPLYKPCTAGQWNVVSGVTKLALGNAILQVQFDMRDDFGYAVDDVDLCRNINLYNLTQMFGSTIADYIYGLEQNTAGAGVAWFRNLFPKPYYSYNAGETTCVSAVNGDPYWKKDIDWTTQAGTVYHGTVDPVTGELTVDMASISSYAGETLPGAWISDRDVYAPGASPTTGAQVVYELATPLTYQLTAQEIEVLVGKNNVWTSSGPVSVTVEAPFVGTVTNPTPFEARPMLEVSGVGEITINGKTIQIIESVSDFDIDCETMEAEDNSKIYCMDFPELSGGENEIVGDGSITALTVTPRWWTL